MWPPLVVPAARIVVPAVVTALERGGDAQVADPVRATTDYGSAVRRHRRVVVVLAVSIALALSGLGIESASASTRSRLALSSNPDRSNAVRLDGSTVKGQIYVFVRNSKSLRKVAFYLDSSRRKQPPVRRVAPFDFAGTAADGTAVAYDTKKLADGSHTIKVVLTWSDGATSSRRASFRVANGATTTPTTAPTAVDHCAEPGSHNHRASAATDNHRASAATDNHRASAATDNHRASAATDNHRVAHDVTNGATAVGVATQS